jgi:hypothetical protein
VKLPTRADTFAVIGGIYQDCVSVSFDFQPAEYDTNTAASVAAYSVYVDGDPEDRASAMSPTELLEWEERMLTYVYSQIGDER